MEKIVRETRGKLPPGEEDRKKVEAQIHYLEENKERMRYADFRKIDLFVGSGVIEAECKSIIGLRLKQSGMEWSVRGANAIITLRCNILSGRYEDYWEEARHKTPLNDAGPTANFRVNPLFRYSIDTDRPMKSLLSRLTRKPRPAS